MIFALFRRWRLQKGGMREKVRVYGEDTEQRKQLGCQIKWVCRGRLVLPQRSDGGEPSV